MSFVDSLFSAYNIYVPQHPVVPTLIPLGLATSVATVALLLPEVLSVATGVPWILGRIAGDLGVEPWVS